MASVGLFFGSDTGNTEHVAKMIQKELGKNLIDVQDIAKVEVGGLADATYLDSLQAHNSTYTLTYIMHLAH